MPTVTKVDTSLVAEELRVAIRKDVSLVPGVRPRLIGFLANNDPAARKYAEWTGRAAAADGVEYELRECDALSLEAAVDAANVDDGVHGILIYYPVFGAGPSFFGGSMDDQLRDRISPEKDVEGLCHKYRTNLYTNVRYLDKWRTAKSILPCTPLAVVKCLQHVGVYKQELIGTPNPLTGVVVTVVNRSEIVGRPLGAMLANDGATVYSVDVGSIYVMERGVTTPTVLDADAAISRSDVVILGVPSPNYKLAASALKPGAVVVNISSFKNLDENSATADFTHIPLVGRVTVACLELSLLRLYRQYHVPRIMRKRRLALLAKAARAALCVAPFAAARRLWRRADGRRPSPPP